MNEANEHLSFEQRLLTVEQVSIFLNLHPQTVYVMAKLGQLPVLKIGRAVRFDRIELDRWIQKKVDENQEKLLPWSENPCVKGVPS